MPRVMIKGGVWRNTEVSYQAIYIHIFKIGLVQGSKKLTN